MRRRLSSLLFLLVVWAAPAPASELARQPAVAEALRWVDLWLGEQLAYQRLPGLSIGLVVDQELVWARGYGFADLATKRPATPQTLYRLGSITKTLTATAIVQLRDAGKLSLEDPVTRFLPTFTIGNPFPGAPAITLRHLLTHTSGLPREGALPYWTSHEFPTRAELLAAVAGQTLFAPPGESYRYSNLGMGLLGHVIEAASGRPYADYLAEAVFQPLEMSSSTAAPTAEHHERLATPYLRLRADGSRGVFDYYDLGALAAAGNAVSSLEDLARFAALQFRDGPAGGEQILSGYSLREMQRAQFVQPSWSGGRGLGFAVGRDADTTFVSHGGWVGGNRTHLLLVPAEKIAVLVLINADDGNPAVFARKAYDLLAPAIARARKPAAPAAAPKVADPAWQKYLGTYTDPWGWETEVLILGGELVLYDRDYPPAEEPGADITRLKPRPDGSFEMPDGERLVFELDAAGQVRRVQRRYDYLAPVRRATPPGVEAPR
jgi:D-alanyl-D-alanine carboxypeptidase